MRIARVGAAAKIGRQAGGFKLDLGGGFEVACHNAGTNLLVGRKRSQQSIGPRQCSDSRCALQYMVMIALAQIDRELLPDFILEFDNKVRLGKYVLYDQRIGVPVRHHRPNITVTAERLKNRLIERYVAVLCPCERPIDVTKNQPCHEYADLV